MSRMTKVTALDVDSGESEECTITPNSYVVICGPDRYVSYTQTNGKTATITIKTWENDHR